LRAADVITETLAIEAMIDVGVYVGTCGWRDPQRSSRFFPPGLPEEEGSFVYARLPGPTPAGGGRYGAAALRGWATRVANWQRKGNAVFALFANADNGCAFKDAQLLNSHLRHDRR